jgi:hypothetical protein
MEHEWVYSEDDHRKCKRCLMEECLTEDDVWIWVSSEDFMECRVSCSDGSM